MSNFLFLKKNNGNLFNIISEAEKLFRDEYFEQTMIQTRRFAENICKELLQDKVLSDETFDSMIKRIKDKSFGNIRMQEFSDDLYFLKKHGNNSAHSSVAVKNGKTALECLERAFEIAIFYSNIRYGYNKKLDKEVFSEELLMTGKKTGKKSSPIPLTEKYSTELKKSRTKSSGTKSTKPNKPKKTAKKQKPKSKRKTFKTFKMLVFIVLFIILVTYGYLYFVGLI